MPLDHPERIALLFFAYLAALGAIRRRPLPGVLALAAAGVLLTSHRLQARLLPVSPWLAGYARDVWMLALLFAGYRVAGLFFQRPDRVLEQRLLRLDRDASAWLGISAASRVAVRAAPWLELAYLCVYPMIPLGAWIVTQRSPLMSELFWTLVLASGYACYGALPWLQTRPPRALEPVVGAAVRPTWLRRLNAGILEWGSIGANTLPSGHAATAVAVALGVSLAAPAAGAAFTVLAAAIAVATVVRRYHYLADTVLGIGVALLVALVFG
jgi:hypothetical protein